MALLHGSWIPSLADVSQPPAVHGAALPLDADSTFFVWGEVWRSVKAGATTQAVPLNPYGMKPTELAAYLRQQDTQGLIQLPEIMTPLLEKPPRSLRSQRLPTAEQPVQWQERQLGMLAQQTEADVPQLKVLYSSTPLTETDSDSVRIYPVKVTGLCLRAEVAVALLRSLPLWTAASTPEESWLGADMAFWSHVARWSLDLLVRSKFVPTLALESGSQPQARWQPLLDSDVDQARYRDLCDRLPLACRFYGSDLQPISDPALPLPLPSQTLLLTALQQMVDQHIRSIAATQEWPGSVFKGKPIAPVDPAERWLMALGQPAAALDPEPQALAPLATAWETWIQPIQSALSQQQPFRVAFHLEPPLPPSREWTVTYGLQARADHTCWLSAEVIWQVKSEALVVQGHRLEQPQEALLAGLGFASRIYPPLEESLQTARPVRHRLRPHQAYEFLKTTTWRLEDSGFGVILPPSLANREGWANRLGLHVRAAVPTRPKAGPISLNSLLSFKWELTIGGQTLSKAEFDRLVQQDSPLVEINGEWVELRQQDIRAAEAFFGNRQQQSGLSLQDALRLSTGDPLTLEKLPIVRFESTGALEELLSTLSGNQSFDALNPPPEFQGTLRPYQARGVGWLAFLDRWNLGACLADDMGLGKTIQLIAFLLHLKANDQLNGPVLLICPTSVLGNWEREIQRFAPTLATVMHYGSGRTQGRAFAKAIAQVDVVLTSYTLAYRDEKTLASLDWYAIVLDEAQNIKNPDARQSQAVRRLQANSRIALTGTPLENRLMELWSILDFLNPGYLGSRAFFQRRFATPIERYGDTASLQTLRALAQPFILRRTKTDRSIIQDLPDKQEMTVFCSLTPEQVQLYEQTVQASLEAVEAAEGIQRRGLILATLTKLKQICNHPAHYLKEEQLTDQASRSGKLKRLTEMLEELFAEGDRALIFTQFAEMGKLLQGYLEQQLSRETLFLYGGIAKAQRESMVDRFQHDPQGPRLFILSLKAGGVGLNLTRANHVFHFDRWWNPAVENQATDRVFRIGQTKNVQVHKFVCRGTLEERIHDMIESKKALAEQVVGTGENWLAELDTQQLRQLLLLDRTAVIDDEVEG